jgi:hypothetical protein
MGEVAAAREMKRSLIRTGKTVDARTLIAARAILCTNVRAAGRPERRAPRACSVRTRAKQPATGKDR